MKKIQRKIKRETMLFDIPKTKSQPAHPNAHYVTDSIRNLVWKGGASRYIYDAVNASLWAHEKWVKRCRNTKITNQRLARFRHHVLGSIPPPLVVIDEWFKNVYEKLSWRRDFSYNLLQYTWDHNHSWWKALGRGWAEAWCQDSRLWDQLMVAIDED